MTLQIINIIQGLVKDVTIILKFVCFFFFFWKLRLFFRSHSYSFRFELVEFVCDDGKSVFICFFIPEPGDERANEWMNDWSSKREKLWASEWVNEVNKFANNHEWKNRIIIWKKLKMNEWMNENHIYLWK